MLKAEFTDPQKQFQKEQGSFISSFPIKSLLLNPKIKIIFSLSWQSRIIKTHQQFFRTQDFQNRLLKAEYRNINEVFRKSQQ